jgi:hypothetical protein
MMLRGLAALAIVLGLVLATELIFPNNPPVAARPPAALTDTVPAGQGNESGADTAWAASSLARPMFRADRRPLAQVSASADTVMPRLTAIIITNHGHIAVFARDDGSKPIVVGPGGSVDGYQVQSIGPDSVQLAGPEGPVSVRPHFAATNTATAQTQSNGPLLRFSDDPPQ